MRATVRLLAENVVIERGGRLIVDQVSLEARGGEAVVLEGPNGAGKTTLLRALAGFLPIAGGRITVDGLGDTSVGSDLDRHELMHVIGHANGIKAHLMVIENLRFWADVLGDATGAAERVAAAIASFQLDGLEDYPAAYLSAGQKRRLGLARLLVAARPIWLLDEPTVSLDVASTAQFAKVVNAHTANGGLVIAATHIETGFERVRRLGLGGGGLRA